MPHAGNSQTVQQWNLFCACANRCVIKSVSPLINDSAISRVLLLPPDQFMRLGERKCQWWLSMTL